MDYDLFSVPFVLDLTNIKFDDAVIFIISALTAILISCEAQGYTATFLGDAEPDKNKRHHFNVFLHLDIKGAIAFLLGGFGWGKVVEVDTDKLKKPVLHTIIIRLSAPVANFLLANIVCSILWVMGRYEIRDKTFPIVVAVNVMVCVYSLIPIFPLPAGQIVTNILKGKKYDKTVYYISLAGPYIIIAVILIEKLTSVKIFSYLNPLVISLFKMIYI